MGIKRAIGLMGFYLFAEKLKDHFVAGETLQDAVRVAEVLKQRGEKAVINISDEHVKDQKEAARFRDEYLKLIYGLARVGLHHTHISVKPSQLGLEISKDLYNKHLGEILGEAERYLPNILVEIDREEHRYAQAVRDISLGFARTFSNQRLCCQINLQETWKEIKQLSEVGISIRLCKGTAYPGDIKDEIDIRRRFFAGALLLSKIGNRPAIATHDLLLIDTIAKSFGQYKDKFEFELLMGIEKNLSREPRFQGFTFRRYITCGPNWRPYGKRRAEALVDIWLRNWWYRFKEKKGGEKNVKNSF